MSRLGKLPIKLPQGTQARIEGDFIIVKGPKGEFREKIHPMVNVDFKEDTMEISVKTIKTKQGRSLWGLYRTLIANLVEGVNEGFSKKLEINGVGYRANVSGKNLILNLGFSHPVEFNIPEGITIKVEENIITVSGGDKKLVGEVTAQIRKIKKPEPYKGKGIKYIDEVIVRKAGKSAAKGE